MWARIPDFSDYAVSTHGEVMRLTGGRGTRSGHILKPVLSKRGYLAVNLRREGKTHTKGIHVLIASAFIPNPEAKPQVNHRDGVKTNNSILNLEWATNAENVKHAYDTGLNSPITGCQSPRAKLKQEQIRAVWNLRADGLSQEAIAKSVGVAQITISRILRGISYPKEVTKE